MTPTVNTKPTVYIETTIVSYLAARPSANLISQAKQQLTHDFWRLRGRCDLYASDAVIREVSAGHQGKSEVRLNLLKETKLLQTTPETLEVAQALIRAKAIPKGSEEDALHVALCAYYEMEYLVTWNCKHIANPVMQDKISQVLRDICQLKPAYLITPDVFVQIALK
jgi:predicted nucleic acid-binding protein